MKQEREKSLERQMRAFHWVRLLAELPGRLAGSREEREAADRVEAWLREIGIEEVSSQPVRGRPRPLWVAGLHLGSERSLARWGARWVSSIAGVTAYSFSRELRARESLFSRWLPAARSLNVIGRAGSNAPSQRVVLVRSAGRPAARLDLFRISRGLERPARRSGYQASRPARGPAAVAEVLLWSAAAAVVARWLGASGFLLAAATMSIGIALAAGALVSLRQARAVRARRKRQRLRGSPRC